MLVPVWQWYQDSQLSLSAHRIRPDRRSPSELSADKAPGIYFVFVFFFHSYPTHTFNLDYSHGLLLIWSYYQVTANSPVKKNVYHFKWLNCHFNIFFSNFIHPTQTRDTMHGNVIEQNNHLFIGSQPPLRGLEAGRAGVLRAVKIEIMLLSVSQRLSRRYFNTLGIIISLLRIYETYYTDI